LYNLRNRNGVLVEIQNNAFADQAVFYFFGVFQIFLFCHFPKNIFIPCYNRIGVLVKRNVDDLFFLQQHIESYLNQNGRFTQTFFRSQDSHLSGF